MQERGDDPHGRPRCSSWQSGPPCVRCSSPLARGGAGIRRGGSRGYPGAGATRSLPRWTRPHDHRLHRPTHGPLTPRSHRHRRPDDGAPARRRRISARRCCCATQFSTSLSSLSVNRSIFTINSRKLSLLSSRCRDKASPSKFTRPSSLTAQTTPPTNVATTPTMSSAKSYWALTAIFRSSHRWPRPAATTTVPAGIPRRAGRTGTPNGISRARSPPRRRAGAAQCAGTDCPSTVHGCHVTPSPTV